MNGLDHVNQRHDDAFSRIDRTALAHLLAAYYRDVGWWVEHGDARGTDARSDDGVDLKIRRDADFVLVQGRYWEGQGIAHDAVDALLGMMASEGATGGILVSSGEFSRGAIDAAQRHGQVKLIDGDALRTMLGPVPELFVPPEAPMPAPARRMPATRVRTNRWLWLVALLSAIAFVFIVRAILDRTADTAAESTADGAPAPMSRGRRQA